MARLTILQASQQGFGSTLTIHRLIKDGSLPIYEEEDVKLLEVDDLISLLGEPGTPVNDNETDRAPEDIDIYEYNRMKSELDQKNKKNMWLTADLAEAVRDIKEKETTFHAERDRLLKILELAQVLLLREAKRAGAGLKKSDVTAMKLDQVSAEGQTAQPQPPAIAETEPVTPVFDQAPIDAPPGEVPSNAKLSLEEMLAFKDFAADTDMPIDQDAPSSDMPEDNLSPDMLGAATIGAPPIVVDEEIRPNKRRRSKEGVDAANPLTPPPEEEIDAPGKKRLIGTGTWILLLSIVGCGLIFLKFQPQIISSIEAIMNVLGRS